MWTLAVDIHRFTDGYKKKKQDQLVMEKEIVLDVAHESPLTLTITPQLEKECVLGYAHLNNLALTNDESPYQLSKVIKDPVPINAHTTSISSIHSATGYVQEKAILFKTTAITESSALCNGAEILSFAEDTTDKHSLYKAFGLAIENDTIFHASMLVISYKIDHHLVTLCSENGISTIVSRTAPTYKAFLRAQELGINLVGFARGRKCNVYLNASLVS